MIIEFEIDKNAYLTHLLFTASKSEQIKNRRRKNVIIISLFYLALGLYMSYDNKHLSAYLFFIVSILWYFLYPLREKNRYIKHYTAIVKEKYKDLTETTITLELNDEYLHAKDNVSESKVLTSEIQDIYEIYTCIFIILKGGQSFVLPKKNIKEIESFSAKLKEVATHLNINYIINEKWEWK